MISTPAGGALLGLAAGDVLGAGYEGRSRRRLRRSFGDRVDAPVQGSVYTDDTQQALVVAYHLLANDRIVPEQLAGDFARLAGLGSEWGSVYRGIGPGFVAFLQHLGAGACHQDAAQPSAGNGAAMRVAPVAVRFHGDLEAVIDQAIEASLVTHSHPTGIAAAVAVAAAVWASTRDQRGRELLLTAVAGCDTAEQRLATDFAHRLTPYERGDDMSHALRAAVDLVGEGPGDIAARVGETAAQTSAFGRSEGTDAYAPASVVTAITVAAGGRSEDGREPVESVVALGGDTDTMGAMAGAIVGASGAVSDWPWPVPNRDLLVTLGERLALQQRGVEDLPDLYQVEAALA